MPVLILLIFLPKLISTIQDIINQRRLANLNLEPFPYSSNLNIDSDMSTETNRSDATPPDISEPPSVEQDQIRSIGEMDEKEGLVSGSEGLKANGNGTTSAIQSTVDYYHPAQGKGSMLDSSGGAGEPLNVIISAKSSSEVLTDAGFLNWAKSVGFSREFLGLHRGTPQMADLGDGHGPKPEIKVIRQDYGIPVIGTGIESLIGGNHFRYWRQDGPSANSGALFLAVSREENVFKQHMIKPDGYNKGRDELVARAVGKTKHGGIRYSTTLDVIEGILPSGAAGINHSIAIDGKSILLTITIIS